MKKHWEKPNCDICKTKKYLSVLWKDVTTWEHPGKFDFVKCKKCGLVFQSPRAPFKDAVNYYPSDTYYGRDITKKVMEIDWKSEREKAYGFLYNGIFKRKRKGAIVDVGSGYSRFLSEFKEKGWEVLGTDISKDVCNFSRLVFGIKVLIGDFAIMKLSEKHYDVVSMNGVMEHIYNPSKTLRKIKKVLKDDGILLVVVPSIESLGYLIHRKDWYHLQPGRHIYQFSPKTIRRLLEDSGFRVEELNHGYWAHNYFSLYENIKYRYSTKFKKKKEGGALLGDVDKVLTRSPFSVKNEIGKIIAGIYAYVGSTIEPLIRRGEVITVYARKA